MRHHHIVKGKDTNGACIYCGHKLTSKFKPENDSNSKLHYVSRKCSNCGKEDRKKSKPNSGLSHSELEKLAKK